MTRLLATVLSVLLLAACGSEEPAATPASVYSIDASRITVSGVSSGAYMATQLHVAYSDVFSGAAMIAGGPYACAQGELKTALGPCLKGGEIDVDALLLAARQAEADGAIAALSNLADDPVWLFHSPSDPIVSPDTSRAAVDFYSPLSVSLQPVFDVPVIHGFPTLNQGVACEAFESPYLNACNYDAAGELLSALGAESVPAEASSGSLIRIPQPGAGDAELLDYAYLYVPQTCESGEACGVHVALHGCVQSAELVEDAFATLAGYNRWADSNRLLVVYPQVKSSSVAPLNPNGCWDWWGYTGDDYAFRDGPQMRAIVDLVDSLKDGE